MHEARQPNDQSYGHQDQFEKIELVRVNVGVLKGQESKNVMTVKLWVGTVFLKSNWKTLRLKLSFKQYFSKNVRKISLFCETTKFERSQLKITFLQPRELLQG